MAALAGEVKVMLATMVALEELAMAGCVAG